MKKQLPTTIATGKNIFCHFSFLKSLYTNKVSAGIAAFCLFILFSSDLRADVVVTVTNPANTSPALSASYPSLALAITALDGITAISGPVVLTCDPGSETAPAGGYVVNFTAVTTATNNVVITGTATTTITASAALTIAALNDAIFKIIGSDFVTISNFTMLENPANDGSPVAEATAATNTMTEWGVALLYASTTNGAQNITIQNNIITLNRIYANTFGIYSNSTHSATAVTTSATATSAAGGNENLKIYNNIISNVNMGIVHVGPTAAADQNLTVDIGGVALATGNNITNFGTTNTGLSGYANLSGTLNGILVRNTKNFNISFNTVNSSNGGVIVGSLNGIQIPASSATPTGTLTQTINNNSISLRPGATGITTVGINMPSGSVNATTTVNMNTNDFNTFGHTVAAATGPITFILQGGNPLVQNFNNNTFTNMSVNTTGAVIFFSFAPSLISTASMSISGNNIVTGFTRTGIGATTVWSSNASSAAGSTEVISNNNFSNITLTGASAFTGISNTDGGAPIKTINGNTFSNISTGAGTVVPISVNFSAGGSTVNNNSITNITTSNSITCLLLGSSNAATMTVSGNLIDPITSGGTVVIGISTASLGTVISKNKIYDLSGSVAGSVVSGIAIVNTTASSTVTVVNNLIGNLTAPAATGSNAVIGINITGSASTSTYNVYYNTVYLNNTTSGAGFGSSGISTFASSTASTSTLNLRNNIIFNTSIQNGAGLTVAYRRSSGAAGTLANYSGSSNNNLFYAGTPSATNLIYSDGTSSAQTISAYKSGVFTAGTIAPRDGASITEDPEFQSTTGSSANFLKYKTTSAKQLESGAVNIPTFTDDFLGTVRQGNGGYAGTGTAPDIGAWELEGIPADMIGPAISYSIFGSTSCLTDRILAPVTVTDASGVNILAGTRPRLYYKKASNVANTFNDNTNGTDGWKFVEATGVSGSPFSFTTNYSLLFGGVPVSSDVIQYFVVAQDNAGTPNVSINAGTFTTPPTSVVLVAANFPVTGPNSYMLVPAGLSGTVTIGAAGTYTSLTGASGLFSAINANGMSGNVTANIIDPTLTENGTNALNAINYNGCAAGPYTLTIKATVPTALSGSSSTAIIILNGADNVIIDGSISATPNTVCPVSTASRDMTITNMNISTTSAVVWLQTALADGATGNTLMNCNLVGNSSTSTLFGVGSGSSTISLSSFGTGNNNNSFVNNNISKTQYGIYSQGANAGNKNSGTIINQNLINSVSPNNVSKGGIVVGFENNILISGNIVSEIAQGSSPDVFGITLGIQGISTSTFSGNEVTNAIVSKNVIGNIRNTGTFSACGICVVSAATGTNQISDNMISGVSANGTSGDFSVGMLIGGGAGSTQVWYNSITMVGTQFGGSDKSYALAIGGSNPIVDVRNNILVNTQNNGTGNNYAIAYGYSTFTNLTSNHNNYYVTPGGGLYFIGATGSISSPTNQLLISDLQTATGKDGMAQNVNPVFIPSALHIDGSNATNLPLNDGAVTIGAITDDIDCELRMTDIGADEFMPPTCMTAIGGTASVSGPSTFCGSGSPMITATGFSSGLGSTYEWEKSNDNFGMDIVGTGQTNPATYNTGTISTTTYYRLRVSCATNMSTDYSNIVTITINPSAAIITPANPVICAGQNIILNETGGTGTSWIWAPGGETTSSIVVSPANTTVYSVTVTSPGMCAALASVTVVVNPLPANVMASASDNSICTGESINLFSSSDTPPLQLIVQDFESGISDWVVVNNTTGGIPANTAWTIEPHPHTSANSTPVTFNSPGGTSFILSNADLGGSGTNVNTLLESPSFNTNGYSTLNLSFRHYYRLLTANEANVEVSTNGTSWTAVKSYIATQGTPTAFATENISLNAFIGFPTVYIRFRYQDGWSWYWAIDDIIVSGTSPGFMYAWTSTPAGFTSALQNPTGVMPPGTRTYTATVSGIGGCTATASTTVTVSTPMMLTTSSTLANCPLQNDGTATVIVTDGIFPYSYLWTSGAMTPTASGLTAGSYTVTVTDAFGCTASATVAVSNNPAQPVHNMNTGLDYCTIQSAINAPLTLNGHKIVVDAGTYNENVIVTKELEIQGAGQGLTIVRPAISDPTGGSLGSVIFKVQANNVLIHDLTVNGMNPLITGATDVDASTGIINDWSTGDWTNMEVHHVTVQDVYSRGLEAANDVNATNTFNFHHNTIDGVQGDASSIAILNYGEAGPINDNTISNSSGGIFTNYGFGSNISNNMVTIPAGATGIESDNNGGAGGGSVADIMASNTVNGGAYGVYIYQPSLISNIHDNTITGASTGIYVNGGPGSANIHDNNATISGSVIGIDVDAASATITNNSIYNNGIGVRFTNGGNGTVNNLNNFDGGMNPDNGRDIQLTATAGAVLASPNNNLAGDIYGVENLTAVNVDATLNYWESPTGPGPIGPGTGAPVSTFVLFCPWLNAPAPGGTPVSTVASISVMETSGFVNNDGIICSGASVTLTASPAGGTYLWAPGGQTTSSITVSPAMTTLYTVTVSYPGCDNVATSNIIVNPSPNATITSNASIYQGSSGNIASVPSGGPGTTYLWSLSSGMITAGTGTNSITYKAGTPPSMNINVTVTSTNGCSSSSSKVVAVVVPGSTTMIWEPDNITPTSCGPSTNCCHDTLCYNLKYTPGVTGFLTTYTTGFFINCLGATTPVGYNHSCVMNDNSFQISQCALIDSVLFNSSGNNGAMTVPVTQGSPIILHRVCLNISTGESVQIREDNVTNLSASVDQVGSGHLTEFPTYTTQTFSKPAPIIPANVTVMINCPADTLFPVPPPVVDFCGNNVPATLVSRVSSPSSLSCEGTKVYNFNYIDCSGYTQPWSYTYIVEYLDFTIATPPGGSIVACPALSNVVPTPPVVIDNCGRTLSPSISDSGMPACEGIRFYVFTYTDCEGNTHNWVYTYFVEYEPIPNPVDVTQTVNCPLLANVVPVPPTVVDNCGITLSPSGPTSTPALTAMTCEGTRSFTWTYVDCEGNTQDFVYTYIVERQPFADPVDGGVTVGCPAQTNVIPVPPMVLDNCGTSLSPSGPVVSPIPACEGTRTYTWTYTDCEGNTGDYVFTYTVDRPPFIVPADAGSIVNCPEASNVVPLAPVIVDACGVTLIPIDTIKSAPVTCQGVDVTRTYTFHFMDCSGLTFPWVYTYTVRCFPLTLKVFLEGPYDAIGDTMRATLNTNHVLPGQDKMLSPSGTIQALAPYTPFGQPYNMPPWNYNGNTGLQYGDPSSPGAPMGVIPYPPDVVDWVLVTVRKNGILPANDFWSCAGWVHTNGVVTFPDPCPGLVFNPGDSCYVLVQHRTHLGALSTHAATSTCTNYIINWDFTTSNSYAPIFRYGQKLVEPGKWAMHAGNGDQISSIAAIGSSDLTTWRLYQNAYGYNIGDYDMSAWTESAGDEFLWKGNQNRTSGIIFY